MSDLIFRIEHADNTTTGICESCHNYGTLTLEKINDDYQDVFVYICDICQDQLERDIFGTLMIGGFRGWQLQAFKKII